MITKNSGILYSENESDERADAGVGFMVSHIYAN